MKGKTVFKLLPIPCLALALAGLLIHSPGVVSAQAPDSIIITLRTPSYQVTTDSDGFDLVQMEGFDRSGAPGDPELPGKIYSIAVPPDVNWASLTVEILSAESSELLGSYEIAPAPPFATWVDGQQIIDWGENVASIVDSKNTEVYQSDAYFPASYVTSVAQSQMRKWRFVRLLFTPVQYNPITKKLRMVTEIEVRVAFERRSAAQAQAQAELDDSLMDDEAAQILYNYDQAKSWYQPSISLMDANADSGYVIITTNAIAASSSKLDDFVAHKQARGYNVKAVTEDDYGGLTGQAPNGTAEKIRQWLIDNYLTQHIEYVLLIGNPDPDDPSSGSDPVGDVPTKMCWPRHHASRYRESPTDYFYADLTGNWDLDGDTYFGEYNDDRGNGGVDFAIEVYVGRIPVYTHVSGWETTLDNILQKIMDYDNASNQAWRKAALLPMSFSDPSTDGAYLAEHMKSGYLNSNGYTAYTLYQQVPGSNCDSTFDSDEPLLDRAVRNHWQNNNYGIVTWWAHGSSTGAYINCGGGTLLSSYDTPYLDDSHPAFVYQASCDNGFPEYSDNLGYALLKQGAIGTVSASRVSWYTLGTWSPNPSRTDNATIGYYFMQRIVNVERAGKALYDQKSTMNSSGWWMNLMVFNLYGDPSTRILSGGSICNDLHEPNDAWGQATSIAYGDTLTDSEICLQGDVDHYAFTGHAGDRIVADIDAKVIGSALNSYLSLYDSSGVELTSNDDYDGLDPHIEYTLPADGTYYLLVRASDHPNAGGLDHFYTLRLFAVASFPLCDGFEGGSLGTGWMTYTTNEGRVQVSSSYPYSGTYSVLLDNSVDSGNYSHAALILTIDLSGQSVVDLDFWWRDFNDEDHATDGVFLSDDWGTTWFTATNFTGSRSSFTNEIVAVDAIVAANGLTLNDHLQIKFQFYDNKSVPLDGYAIDEICVQPSPRIEVFPTSFEETVGMGEMVTETLTISNTGTVETSFSVYDLSSANTQVGVVGSKSSWAATLNADSELSSRYTFVDLGDNWTYATIQGYAGILVNERDHRLTSGETAALRQYYDAGGPVLLGMDDVDEEGAPEQADVYHIFGVTNAQDGNFYVGALNTAHPIAQGVTLSDIDGDSDHFDGDSATWVVRGDDGNDYVLARAPVPADGAARAVIFGRRLNQWWSGGNQQLVRNAINWAIDVPWLSGDPITGTVLAGSAVPVTLTFDASQVDQPGVYQASLEVRSNAPRTPIVSVPVTMTAPPPATWGKLESTIRGLGHCDANPAPLVNTDVLIESRAGTTWTLTTDDRGAYSMWLDEAHSPLTVTVTHPDHATGQATGITITAQETTTQDLDLRWLRPCLSVTPTDMSVTLALSKTATQTLIISNSGALTADLALFEAEHSLALAQPQIEKQLHAGGQAHLVHEAKEEAIPDAASQGPLPLASGGPDPFGYTYKDSHEVGGPIYQWIEIAPPAGGAGTEITDLTGVDDGHFWPLVLPFVFNFYGTDYAELAVASNGTLYFEHDYLGLSNTPIPGPNSHGVDTFIAHLWDDLVIDPGAVYYQAVDSMFVIEYYQVRGFGTSGRGIWEVILFENGNLLFQYQDAAIGGSRDYGSSATVGIQGDTTTGLQYSYNTAALSDGLAICFTYPGQSPNCALDVPWLSENPTTGSVAADSTQTIDVVFDTSVPEVMQLGEYYATLVIQSNDPVMPQFRVPVTMSVAAYGVTLAPSVDARSGDPGATVTYTLQVTNTGTAADTFNLIASGHTWPTSAPPEIGPLAAGGSATVDVVVNIPSSAVGGATDSATISVTSPEDDSRSATATLTTAANTIHGVMVRPATDAQSGDAGAMVTYTLQVTNTGNVTGTFDVAVSGHTWPTSAPPEIGPLAAGGSATVDVVVNIPSSAVGGATDMATVIVTSQGDNTQSATATLTTQIPSHDPPSYNLFLPLVIGSAGS